MQQHVLRLFSIIALLAVLALDPGRVQAQTPGYVPYWLNNLSFGDSVISQDADGRITIEADIPNFNGTAIILFNRNGGNTNKWALGTGGFLGPHFFSIGDTFAYRLVIDDRNGSVGIGTTNPAAKLHSVASGPAESLLDGVRGTNTGEGPWGGAGVYGESVNGPGVRGRSENFSFGGSRHLAISLPPPI